MTSPTSYTIRTVVGTGEAGYTGDGGPATDATLREPFMCSFDTDGNLFFCEARNHIVRRVDANTGVVTTVAGTGEPGYSGDGGSAVAATLNEPYSLEVDADGSIYIVDRLNAAVRRVEGATGVITTVAGTGTGGLFRRWRPGPAGPAARTQRLLPRPAGRPPHCRHPGPAHSPP